MLPVPLRLAGIAPRQRVSPTGAIGYLGVGAYLWHRKTTVKGPRACLKICQNASLVSLIG